MHVVFAGHNHNYARAIVDNVHHITTGGGGADLYEPDPSYPNIVACAMAHHFCKVEIRGPQLSVTVLDISENIIDEFTIEDLSLPVELIHFYAYQEENMIILEWATESEVENLGFILERREPEDSAWQEIASYCTCEQLIGQGSIAHRTEYRYEDNTAEIGKSYEYRLADVNQDGIRRYHTMTTLVKMIPVSHMLYQNYPNPFDTATVIGWQVGAASKSPLYIELSIYNILGQRITTLVSERQQTGVYQLEWDARHLSSGVYYYRIKAGTWQDVKKMLILR